MDVAVANEKREDYFDKLFDDVTNEGDRRQAIDDGINKEDILIDDKYLLDGDHAQETKILCDYVLDNVDQNDILFKYEPAGDTWNYHSPPETLLLFSDILLPKNKNREKLAKKFFKKYQELRRKRKMVENREKNPSITKEG